MVLFVTSLPSAAKYRPARFELALAGKRPLARETMTAKIVEQEMLQQLLRDRGIVRRVLFTTAEQDLFQAFELEDEFFVLGMAIAGPSSTCFQGRIKLPRNLASIEEDTFAQHGLDCSDEEERVVLIQSLEIGKSAKPKQLKRVIAALEKAEVNRLILFSDNKLSNTGIHVTPGLIIESLKVRKRNMVQHVRIPPHRRLNAAEVIHLENTYGAICSKINSDDVVAAYYGFPVGSVVEILQPNESTGVIPEYRVVVVPNS
jgi:DNA-directed RNA polymerase subunit H (RpoH/RPB5)